MTRPEFIFPPNLPEGLREQFERMMDRQDMLASDWAHSVARYLDSLDKDQLITTKSILQSINAMIDGNKESITSYYIGLCAAILHYKYNICLACGENHNEVLESIGKENTDHVETLIKEATDNTDLMKMYGVRHHSAPGTLSVICEGCGQQYPNLEDRMLRDPGPEGCPGCIQKAKWG